MNAHEFAPVLDDLATLALVVAHGLDADLDPRETEALGRGLEAVAVEMVGTPLSGAEVRDLFSRGVESYRTLSVGGLDAIVQRLAVALDLGQRRQVLRTLHRVASADGVVHTMERTVLDHVASAWGVEGER